MLKQSCNDTFWEESAAHSPHRHMKVSWKPFARNIRCRHIKVLWITQVYVILNMPQTFLVCLHLCREDRNRALPSSRKSGDHSKKCHFAIVLNQLCNHKQSRLFGNIFTLWCSLETNYAPAFSRSLILHLRTVSHQSIFPCLILIKNKYQIT